MAKAYHGLYGPEDFPTPASFGLFRKGVRAGVTGSLTIHDNLSLVKSAITNRTTHDDKFRQPYEVYEFVEGEWCLIYEMAQGEQRKEHPLWKNGAAPKTAGISEKATDKAVAEAIASLTTQGSSST